MTVDKPTEQIKQYPPARTLLPDEIDPLLGAIAYVIGGSVAYSTAPLMPGATVFWAVSLSPAYVLFAYVLLHFMTGRRWIVEGDG